ncbi:MAG: bifunctional riboflavin kinase/FAD synthetase [Flammeovirgaceae bacterium]
MQTHFGLENIQKLANAIVTSGTFDGVHIGHQKILARLSEVAKQASGESVVLTFWPHPRLVLFPDQTDLRLLSSLQEKMDLLGQYGIDHLIVLTFSKAFAATTSHDFIQKILVDQIGTKKLVIGYDHRFGRNREGGFDYLKAHSHEFGLEVEEIPRQDIDDVGVSSTKIRKALLAGDIYTANNYLGGEYMLTGNVVKGEQVGRTIGYPTANLEVDEPYKLIPEDGIYAVRVLVRKQVHQGMLYIGTRPTIGAKLKRAIEVNIFEFNQDIYHETIRVYFVKALRKDEKFQDLASLQKQLEQDKLAALEVLNR